MSSASDHMGGLGSPRGFQTSRFRLYWERSVDSVPYHVDETGHTESFQAVRVLLHREGSVGKASGREQKLCSPQGS